MVEADPADNSCWILTRSRLLIHYSSLTKGYQVFDLALAAPNTDGALPGSFNDIRFVEDRVVISTYTGSWQVKKGENQIRPFDLLPTGYAGFRCAEILPLGDSAIYFNNGKELLYWNRITQQSALLRFRPGMVPLHENKTFISGLIQGPENRIWAKSSDGHLAFTNADNSISRVKIIRDNVKEMGAFTSVAADKNQNLWVLECDTKNKVRVIRKAF